MKMKLDGVYKVTAGEYKGECFLPGKLVCENESNHLSGVTVYEKMVALTKEKGAGSRNFISMERGAVSQIFVQGMEAYPVRKGTLSTPSIFEIPEEFDDYERTRLSLVLDSKLNGGMGNTLGVWGDFSYYSEEKNYISGVQVLADKDGLNVCVEIDAKEEMTEELTFSSDFLEKAVSKEIIIHTGCNHFSFHFQNVIADCKKWDILDPKLYRLTIKGKNVAWKQVRFGYRYVWVKDGFRINEKKILKNQIQILRDAEKFSQYGVEEWKQYFQELIEQGVFMVKFSHECPMEAAFCAADEVGFLLFPEMSVWDEEGKQKSIFVRDYLCLELTQMIRFYGNHPSLVGISLGDLDWKIADQEFLVNELLSRARKMNAFLPVVESSEELFKHTNKVK